MKNELMEKPGFQWPISVKLCFQILLMVLIGFIIEQCKAILVPIYFSVLLSILLLPIANFFEKIKFPRSIAALVSVLLALMLIVILIYLLSSQVIAFSNDIPSIRIHLAEHYQTFQYWIEQSFNISVKQQSLLVNNAKVDMTDSGVGYLRATLFTLSQVITFIIFSIICSFLMLYYRHTLRKFLFALFDHAYKTDVHKVITGSKQVIKSYMTGLIIEMVIISICNIIVLLLIGIKYAVFLAVLTAVLNIIPFVGIYSGTIFTALVTLTTNASMSQIIWIFIGLLGIHFVDTNFLMPRIVGSRVKINALMTILAALLGGFLIGIPGVFLALPTIAILKIIFDTMENMKPWAILLGDESEAVRKKATSAIVKNPNAEK